MNYSNLLDLQGVFLYFQACFGFGFFRPLLMVFLDLFIVKIEVFILFEDFQQFGNAMRKYFFLFFIDYRFQDIGYCQFSVRQPVCIYSIWMFVANNKTLHRKETSELLPTYVPNDTESVDDDFMYGFPQNESINEMQENISEIPPSEIFPDHPRTNQSGR